MKKHLPLLQYFIVGLALFSACSCRVPVRNLPAKVWQDADGNQKIQWQATPNDLGTAAAELPSAYKEFRRRGFPYTADDLPIRRAVDDSENPENYIISAERQFQLLNDSLTVLKPVPGSPTSQLPQTRVARVFDEKDCGPIFKMLSAAMARNPVLYRSDSHHYDGKGGYHWSYFRELIELVCQKAEREAQLGRADLSAQTLEEGWKLSRLLDQEAAILPTYVSVSGSTAVERSVDRCLTLLFHDRLLKEDPYHLSPLGSDGQTFLTFRSSLPLEKEQRQLELAMRKSMVEIISITRQMDGNINGVGGVDGFALAELKSNDPFPKTIRGKANLSRILQYWTQNEPNLKTIDRSPLESTFQMDTTLTRTRLNPTQSYEALDEFQGEFAPLGQMVDESRKERAAELLLLDAMRIRSLRGVWPKSLADLPASRNLTDSKLFHLYVGPKFVQIYRVVGPNANLPIPPILWRNTKPDERVVVASYPAIANSAPTKKTAPSLQINEKSLGGPPTVLGAFRSSVAAAPGPKQTK